MRTLQTAFPTELTPALRIFDALDNDVLFVGGCVRNHLLHEPLTDIDLATPLPPDEVVKRLEAKGIATIPTGLAHGTITARVDDVSHEITSLRKDVSTDGRRATIAFTDDWAEDAQRRDFTINALYMCRDGVVRDYVSGLPDIASHTIRFVGDADRRLKEDHLRSLRYFRFHARYSGLGNYNQDAQIAIRDNAKGIVSLSGERIQKEMFGLLQVKKKSPSWEIQEMINLGVSEHIFPQVPNVKRLMGLDAIGLTYDWHPEHLLRLAALLKGPLSINTVTSRWRLSTADHKRLTNAMNTDGLLGVKTREAMRKLVYRNGWLAMQDRAILEWSQMGPTLYSARYVPWVFSTEHYKRPVFPVRSEEIKELGVPEGKRFGEILRLLESWWVESDFSLSSNDLIGLGVSAGLFSKDENKG